MKKIAVVVTHGMGEQVPMETLRGFVQTAWVDNAAAQWSKTPKDEKAADIWFMPDARTGSLELRRITTRWTESKTAPDAKGPRIDFFEFFWADLAEGTTVHEVSDWLGTLLWRWPGQVPKGLMGIWLALWFASALVFVLSVFAVLPWPGGWWHAGLAAAAAVSAYVVQYVVSPYIGDVARYVRADPRNIAMRRSIRERGLKLLQDLHDSGEYQRIVMVAHSLGSIIAYDLVAMFWASRKEALAIGEGEPAFQKLRAVETAAHELDKATDANRLALLAAYRKAQRSLRLEMRSGGEDGKGRTRSPNEEWLISDLVTLGSPLTHAAFLLVKNDKTLADRTTRFLFPTCWPQFQPIQTEQENKIKNRPVPPSPQALAELKKPAGGLFSYFSEPPDTWRLHHAAPFAAVRWTNIFDPHRPFLKGDIISGPLAGVFGRGIRDIDLQVVRGGTASSQFSHTLYWTATKNDDPKDLHLDALRAAIDLLDTPDG
jgi:hypothetical protein